MQSSSAEYQAELITLTKARDIYGKVEFRQLDVDARADCTPTASSTESISSPTLLTDGVEGVSANYATFETDRWSLGGNFKLLPISSYASMGWWSTSFSDATTRLYSVAITITLQFTINHSSVGLTILWDNTNNEYAEDFVVIYYNSSNAVIQTTTVTGNTLSEYVDEVPITNYRKVIITITKWSVGNRRARIEEVLFGVVKVFSRSNGKLISFMVQEEIDVIASKDVSNKLDLSIDNSDNAYDILNPTGIYQYMQVNQEVNAYLGISTAGIIEYVSVGKFFLSTWETNQNSLEAKFSGTDLLDLLHQKKYYKGLKQSITLYNLAVAVLGDYGLTASQYSLDSALSGVTVTNFLPICSYKEALQHIAIAGQCVFYIDRAGRVVLERVGATSTELTIYKDSMREPTPKITLQPVLKQVSIEVTTPTIAAGSTTIAKATAYINGTQDIWVVYDKPADTVSGAVSLGSINSATYYTNACLLNITSTGNTTITISGKEITLSKSLHTVSTANVEGIIQNVKTQLIDTNTLADSVADWIVVEMEKRKVLSVQSRTNPALELTDIIDIETQFDTYSDTRVVKQSYEYDGALKGIVEVRG